MVGAPRSWGPPGWLDSLGPQWAAPRPMIELPDDYFAYRPRGGVCPPEVWGVISPVVLEIAARAEFPNSAVGKRQLTQTSRFVAWCYQRYNTVDLEQMFDPKRVDYYADHACTPKSAGTTRSALRRIGRIITVNAPWEPRANQYPGTDIAEPYSREEVPLLRKIVNEQVNSLRRRNGRVMLACGLGAGLDGRWVSKVVPDDVLVDGDGVLIRVGYPAPRIVPVLYEWEEEVARLKETAQDEYLIGGRTRTRTRASDRARAMQIPPGCPELSLGRLRSTWLLHHLTVATPLPELHQAAGILTFKTVSRLVERVDLRPADEGRRLLRGLL